MKQLFAPAILVVILVISSGASVQGECPSGGAYRKGPASVGGVRSG